MPPFLTKTLHGFKRLFGIKPKSHENKATGIREYTKQDAKFHTSDKESERAIEEEK